MDENTVSEFTQSLAFILASYVDATNKIKALEAALKEHDPVFYELYLDRLEKDGPQDKLAAQVSLAVERLQEFLTKR